jgi:FKBP-type peptidyl-prolyl cis-trans isomerase FkpA
MKLKSVIALLISFCLLSFGSCKHKAIEPNRPTENKQKEELIQVNRSMIKQDAFLISTFVKRQKWDVKETESGLWIGIYKKGKGKIVKAGKLVTIKYRLSLLDGTICNSSDSTGYKKFVVGAGKVEVGLEEGVSSMHLNDAAHIIIPPHLGLGLFGDGNCIPARSILVYDVILVSVD